MEPAGALRRLSATLGVPAFESDGSAHPGDISKQLLVLFKFCRRRFRTVHDKWPLTAKPGRVLVQVPENVFPEGRTRSTANPCRQDNKRCELQDLTLSMFTLLA